MSNNAAKLGISDFDSLADEVKTKINALSPEELETLSHISKKHGFQMVQDDQVLEADTSF
jgi:hypothetical protein